MFLALMLNFLIKFEQKESVYFWIKYFIQFNITKFKKKTLA